MRLEKILSGFNKTIKQLERFVTASYRRWGKLENDLEILHQKYHKQSSEIASESSTVSCDIKRAKRVIADLRKLVEVE